MKRILTPYAGQFAVKVDCIDKYYLYTKDRRRGSGQRFAGGVRILKTRISFYLIPLGLYPELLDGMSPELKKRVSGKFCFNFDAVDDALLKELGRLTEMAFRMLDADSGITRRPPSATRQSLERDSSDYRD